MEYNQEDIHILLIEKISGTIDPQDEAWLDTLIREERSVADMWHTIQAAFATPAGREALDPARHLAFVEKVERSMQERRRRKILRTVSYAAASAALLIGVWALFYQPHIAPGTAPGSAQHISLQLGNGRVIPLDGHAAKETIQLDNARLHTRNNTLTYITAGNAAVNTLCIPAGKDYTLVLSDGSVIRLNAGTTLSFPFTFTGKNREIAIDGEAFFKIARRAGQPFIVHTPQSDIEVLGTSFNVNTYNDTATAIALMEGAVKVTAGNSVRILQPGYRVTYHRHRGMDVTAFDRSEVLSWLNGEFFFHDASLEEIARVIARLYGIKVVLDSPSITNKHFSGVINKKKPVTAFLEHLQKTSEASYYYKDNALHFK